MFVPLLGEPGTCYLSFSLFSTEQFWEGTLGVASVDHLSIFALKCLCFKGGVCQLFRETCLENSVLLNRSVRQFLVFHFSAGSLVGEKIFAVCVGGRERSRGWSGLGFSVTFWRACCLLTFPLDLQSSHHLNLFCFFFFGVFFLLPLPGLPPFLVGCFCPVLCFLPPPSSFPSLLAADPDGRGFRACSGCSALCPCQAISTQVSLRCMPGFSHYLYQNSISIRLSFSFRCDPPPSFPSPHTFFPFPFF